MELLAICIQCAEIIDSPYGAVQVVGMVGLMHRECAEKWRQEYENHRARMRLETPNEEERRSFFTPEREEVLNALNRQMEISISQEPQQG